MSRSPRIAARTPRWSRGLSVALAALGALSIALGAVTAVRTAGPVAASGALVDVAALEVDYADAPSDLLVSYEHGAGVHYAVELRNDGPLPLAVREVPLDGLQAQRRLLHPTGVRLAAPGTRPDQVTDARTQTFPFEPFTLGSGESRTIVVEGVFYNCAFFTERAMDVVSELPVTWSVLGVGRTEQVALPDRLAIRSPYLRLCPGRVMDRGARTRAAGG